MKPYTYWDDRSEDRYPNPLNDERVEEWPDLENHMLAQQEDY